MKKLMMMLCIVILLFGILITGCDLIPTAAEGEACSTPLDPLTDAVGGLLGAPQCQAGLTCGTDPNNLTDGFKCRSN